METIARAVVSAVELAEGELRMIRRETVRLAATLGFGLIALICLILGLVSILRGTYGHLAELMGGHNAAILVGIIWTAAAAGLLVYVKRRLA